MWDPHNYEDTDYGLDEGESFEPELDPDEAPFDTSLPHVMTILGPIDPEELGVCIPASRLLSPGIDLNDPRALRRATEEAAEELEGWASIGGRSVVDLATANTGRVLASLQQLTQLVPSHLVASTGPSVGSDRADDLIQREVTDGVDGSGVMPGAISIEIPATTGADLVTSIIPVAIEHGYPLIVTVPSWDTAAVVLDAWPAQSRSTLTITVPAGLPDTSVVARAQTAGAFLSLAAPGPGHPQADDALVRGIADLVERGALDHLLVTMEFSVQRPRPLVPTEPRTPYLIDKLAIDLMEAGLSAFDVRALMIDNPAVALTIRPAN